VAIEAQLKPPQLYQAMEVQVFLLAGDMDKYLNLLEETAA
jgi:hypothetical protein